jgi:hypothetical protein
VLTTPLMACKFFSNNWLETINFICDFFDWDTNIDECSSYVDDC